MSHRVFEVPAAPADAPSFELAGHQFVCLPEPPGIVLMDLVRAVGQDMGAQAAAIIEYLEGCLPTNAVDEFRSVLHGKDTIISIQFLGEISEWLAEEYAGRPTTPSSGSDAGSPSTPATPVDGSDSPVSTPPVSVS